MEKDERMLIAMAEDKYRQCERRNMITHTAFLDVHQITVLDGLFRGRGAAYAFNGGYEDAERRMLFFFPDEVRELDEDELPISVLRVSAPKGSRPLSHRDYLGSMMSLGIDREVTGDILAGEGGADILVMSDMAEYLMNNFTAAGRVSLSARIVPLSQLDAGIVKTETFSDTLASLRLDSAVASAFRVSRGTAAEAVRQGLVYLNNRQVFKPDAPVDEGDRMTFRGKGKAVIKEIGGRSRKDRTYVTFEKYV